MVAFFLIILEGFFNAVMDSVETLISFAKSIFKNKNPLYWSKVDSANHHGFVKGTKFRNDAWHDAKFFSICCVAFNLVGMVFFTEVFLWPIPVQWLQILIHLISELHWALQVIIFFILVGMYGLLRNGSFNLFFNKVFNKNANNRKV
jgi:hypothetical protein